MNPDDMERENLLNGEMVEVKSKNGKIRAPVIPNSDVPSGVLFTTFHYNDLPTNVLTPDTYDKPTKTPAYKDTRVKIIKINS